MASIELGTNYICDVCNETVNTKSGYPSQWTKVKICGYYWEEDYDNFLFCAECKPDYKAAQNKTPERRRLICGFIKDIFSKTKPTGGE